MKGYSKQTDLAPISGRLWFEACVLMLDHTAQSVASHLNIADGPSSNDVALPEELGASERRAWVFPGFSEGFGSWIGCWITDRGSRTKQMRKIVFKTDVSRCLPDAFVITLRFLPDRFQKLSQIPSPRCLLRDASQIHSDASNVATMYKKRNGRLLLYRF